MVWVDDVSFREVFPAAISVTMDQPRYDGLDRVAIARVSLSDPIGQDRLRILLEDSEGAQLEDDVAGDFTGSRRLFAESDVDAWYVTAPSGDRPRIVLDPSALAFGRHTLQLQRLRGAEPSRVGETATTFERIPSLLESPRCPPR
jgi:hypothetical protein